MAVVAELEAAADSLGAAQDRVAGPLAQPLRLIPIVAQHRHAVVVVATTQGRDIARQASRTTVDADISSVSMNSRLRRPVGSVIDGSRPGEHRRAARNRGRRTRRPPGPTGLFRRLASRMQELTDEMRDVLPEARVAADAARVLPRHARPRRPSPLLHRVRISRRIPRARRFRRKAGPYSSSMPARYARSMPAGSPVSTTSLVPRAAEVATTTPRWYVDRARPHRWPQNITGSPDLATVAAGSRDVFEGIAGGSIDGFVYLDAYALSALLELTGPLRIDRRRPSHQCRQCRRIPVRRAVSTRQPTER